MEIPSGTLLLLLMRFQAMQSAVVVLYNTEENLLRASTPSVLDFYEIAKNSDVQPTTYHLNLNNTEYISYKYESYEPNSINSNGINKTIVSSQHYVSFQKNISFTFSQNPNWTKILYNDFQSEMTSDTNLTENIHPHFNKTFLNDYVNYTCYNLSDYPNKVCIPEVNMQVFRNEMQLYDYIKTTLLKSAGIITVLKICRLTYIHLYGKILQLNEWVSGNTLYGVVYEELSIEVCLPLFHKLSHCSNETYFTRCIDGQNAMMFVHDHRHDAFDINTNSLDWNGTHLECFQKLFNGTYNIVELLANDIKVFLYPANNGCQNFSLALIMDRYNNFNHSLFITYNLYWPCCYANHYVVWEREPEAAGLNRDWSYLPIKCRAGEIFFVIFGGFVAVIGIFGNLLVIIVMLLGGHRNEASSFLRTSLSVSDFLICSTVVIPAFHNNVALINGYPNSLLQYHIDFIKSPKNSSINFRDFYERVTYTEEWFVDFHSHIMCMCAAVSIITMFVLSVERMILASMPLKYKVHFTLPRVRKVIIFSWVFGVITFSMLLYDGCPVINWYGWTKLTAVTPDAEKEFLAYMIISAFLLFLVFSTVILSVLSLLAFYREQAKVAAEWKSLNMRVTGNFKSENIYIAMSLVIIGLLNAFSAVPIGATNMYGYTNGEDITFPIMQYLFWWIFLAGSAANPFVYNMRSHLFKSDVAMIAIFSPHATHFCRYSQYAEEHGGGNVVLHPKRNEMHIKRKSRISKLWL
ncbi:hypothetical protein SK128_019096 [Halocaridina rubra]|uniref:G-protein coupled receptors family 1 profile domain-containing protein n=1 Tax=Halocaridina rubra TaxID=373956 RepID=A0AAN8ZYE4_HALRR